MTRGWVWLQLIVGWLPIWALFTTLIVVAHNMPVANAAFGALRMIAAGAVLGIGVHRFTARVPWPYPFRLSFLALHLLAAGVYALSWITLISIIDSVYRGELVIVVGGAGIGAFLVTGIWLYVMVAGVTYANRAAQRTALIEAQAARAQLAALRTQLHPHFLFNALHTVVQLIPTDPRGATRAAEQLAGALRIAIEEQRDLITLGEEWDFVQRYLAIECIRFGDRLQVRADIDASARAAILPSFALQTLVENAIRHGAAPRVEATELLVRAKTENDTLTLTVADNGAGANMEQVEHGAGTGLRRLRERLAWLYGNGARLELASATIGGFCATLRLPQSAHSASEDPSHANDGDE